MLNSEAELRRASIITKSAFVFGAAATILINLAHADSGLGPKLTSLIAPISILFVVEIMLLLPTPESAKGKWLKFGGAGVIGLAALSISYFHTAQLFIEYGESVFMSWVTPLVPDGMMVMASVAMVYLARLKEQFEANKAAELAKEQARLRRSEERKAAAARRGPTAAQKLQEEGRNYIRVEMIAGNDPTAKTVAAHFGKSESWARDRISDVKKEVLSVS